MSSYRRPLIVCVKMWENRGRQGEQKNTLSHQKEQIIGPRPVICTSQSAGETSSQASERLGQELCVESLLFVLLWKPRWNNTVSLMSWNSVSFSLLFSNVKLRSCLWSFLLRLKKLRRKLEGNRRVWKLIERIQPLWGPDVVIHWRHGLSERETPVQPCRDWKRMKTTSQHSPDRPPVLLPAGPLPAPSRKQMAESSHFLEACPEPV